MIAMSDLVVEDGKFKRRLGQAQSEGGGTVTYTTDLTDEEALELWEALRDLDLRASPPGFSGFKSETLTP
jgi:hypothetical protein